ncbi:MAG TPA: right-handed parallel beta-helix repeat-containing protein [Solirubrobacteraceae bacterium]
MRKVVVIVCLLAAALLAPATASAHPERTTFYPDYTLGKLPDAGRGGKALYVCNQPGKPLRKAIKRSWKGKGPKRTKERKKLLRLAKKCRFRDIQAAVDAAQSGYRIRIFPGTYTEEPSRAIPLNEGKCPRSDPAFWENTNDGHGEDGKVPTYRFHIECKNSRNLIQITGDSLTDDDRICDHQCGMTIEGLGRLARHVTVVGDRFKRDVIRADRADGIIIRNLTTEQASFNGIDVVETNGFLLRKLVSRYNQNYGILTFTSDNGLYDNVEAYGNGDSGVYPGSGPEGHCARYGIEIRNARSYGNVLGLSGTAGNGTWTHDSHFYGNAAGLINDSFVPGHPGMPQDCSKWTNNEIHANNINPFELDNQKYCGATPFEKRPRERLCPQFQVPVGSGIAGYGINANTIENNRIYDNWRQGIGLFWVPATIRGENDPAKQQDTSNGNRVLNNQFGIQPGGEVQRNGVDIYWDEQGRGNCWQGNQGARDGGITSDPATLPDCSSGGSTGGVSNQKLAFQVPCATWDPRENPDPPGCDWFQTPPRPDER